MCRFQYRYTLRLAHGSPPSPEPRQELALAAAEEAFRRASALLGGVIGIERQDFRTARKVESGSLLAEVVEEYGIATVPDRMAEGAAEEARCYLAIMTTKVIVSLFADVSPHPIDDYLFIEGVADNLASIAGTSGGKKSRTFDYRPPSESELVAVIQAIGRVSEQLREEETLELQPEGYDSCRLPSGVRVSVAGIESSRGTRQEQNAAIARYDSDPSYLESRFGVPPLSELLTGATVGMARLVVLPSFSPESVYTLQYQRDRITLHAAVGEVSLWGTIFEGSWRQPSHSTRSLCYGEMPGSLGSWSELCSAARAAPTVRIALIGGIEMMARDGVTVRHSILDRETALHAEWSNPTREASNHGAQVALLKAYASVLGDEALAAWMTDQKATQE